MNRILTFIWGKLFRWAAVGAMTLALYLSLHPPQPQSSQTSFDLESLPMETVRRLFPVAQQLELQSPGEPARVVNSSGSLLGYLLASSPLTDQRRGYRGTLPLLLGFDKDYVLLRVEWLTNTETPDVVENLQRRGLQNHWNGKHLKELASVEVDTVSGATLTSQAFINNVRDTSSLAWTRVVEHRLTWSRLLRWGMGLILLLLSLGYSFFPTRLRRIRVPVMVAWLVFLGFFEGQFLSVDLLRHWLSHGIPWRVSPMLVGILGLSVLVPAFANRPFYCGTVCPFGNAQELLGMAHLRRLSPPGWLARILLLTRPLLLAAVVGSLLLEWTFDYSMIEPFGAFLFHGTSLTVVALAVTFLLLSLVMDKPWCRFACPTGQVLDLLKTPLPERPGKSRKITENQDATQGHPDTAAGDSGPRSGGSSPP